MVIKAALGETSMALPPGSVRNRLKVSSGSLKASLEICSVIVLLVSPSAKSKRQDCAVKSVPAVAEAERVKKSTFDSRTRSHTRFTPTTNCPALSFTLNEALLRLMLQCSKPGVAEGVGDGEGVPCGVSNADFACVVEPVMEETPEVPAHIIRKETDKATIARCRSDRGACLSWNIKHILIK